ncbi:glycosyltransferase family 2 protein [Pseudomonas sp. CES]|uniref:glycosyltransferase family 2 protein n=1 Tax=Pseudomonas sp. CES TaxID=2719586 RepID=UPI0014702E5D|nr:glycosyltransferase family 2 protein [Pseudomonas sp. CES]KAF4560184.1 glycosyltransferase family 2 protein [Pseudomonas sp. CES]
MKVTPSTQSLAAIATTPQDALDLLIKAEDTGVQSIYVSALLANLAIGNFEVCREIFSSLQGDPSVPTDLMCQLNEKMAKLEARACAENTPTISVVIPYHNREKIIQQCIESVLNQTITNLEVIAVDDGSTDRSREIVANINDKRLVRINCDIASGNSGTPRNKALLEAKGEYIAFVDSDDTIDDEYFEELLLEARKQDSDVTIARGFTKCFRDQYGLPKQARVNYLYVPDFITHKPHNYFFINSFVIWDKLYKRSFLNLHGIKLADSKIGADTLMVAKTYYYAKKIAICNNKSSYNYNAFSEGSVTQAFRSKGDIREEDRPYAQVFDWIMKEKIPSQYMLIQWIRRLMSLSYCLSSSKTHMNEDASNYLDETLKEAPFRSVLLVLKKKKLDEQYKNINNLLKILGRKPVHID